MEDFNNLIKELDEIIDFEMNRIFNKERQKKLGKLMFLYKDTFGLTESCIFKVLDETVERKKKEITSKVIKLFLKSDLTSNQINHRK